MERAAVRERLFFLFPNHKVLLLLLCLLVIPGIAHAQIGSARYSSIIVEADNGAVLEAVNPDAPRHPASLAKLMTLYMAFEALRDRRITLNELVPVSAYAASMQPSKLGLVPGTRITVEQVILGLVTKSANDAAAAMGEFLGGSEDRFAQMMTLRARALGMNHTTFTNASGLPDPDQWTTARDLAILARRLLSDFPSYYGYFSTPSFIWQRRVIPNHDNLLRTYPGADGMKTGYTEASGHNLVTSAVRGGTRLIGVVLGASSNAERDVHMASLLDRGFDELDIPIERHGNGTRVASRLSLIARANAAETVREAAARHRPTKSVTSWGIQVGSFSSQRAARDAAANARRVADDGDVRIEPATVHRRVTWRAQVTGLSASEAQSACNTLARRKHPCIVLRPEQGEIAAR